MGTGRLRSEMGTTAFPHRQREAGITSVVEIVRSPAEFFPRERAVLSLVAEAIQRRAGRRIGLCALAT
jgi:hypothetical protein